MQIITLDTQTPAVLIEGEVLERLRRHAYDARGTLSERTERVRKSATKVFNLWCAQEGFTVAPNLPMDPYVIVQFIDAMAKRLRPATVASYVSHVSAMYDAVLDGLVGAQNPCKSKPVDLAKRRMFRSMGRRQKQATGITADIRRQMLLGSPDTLIGLRNRALLALAYDTGLRRAELVAVLVEDLQADPKDGTGSLLVRRSKNDQEGQGHVRFVAADTMRMLASWMQAAELTDGPLFRRVRKGGHVGTEPLHDGEVRRIYKEMAAAAGLPVEVVDGISGHSTRVGGAQDMAAAGATLPEIQQAFGWKTPTMPARYIERLEVKRSGAAKLARLQGRA